MVMPLRMVRVWKADWLLKERCMPLGRKATPAGLLYTPSIAITPSRAGLRRKDTLWLVLVRMPPALTAIAVESNVPDKTNFNLFILNTYNKLFAKLHILFFLSKSNH